MKKNTFNHKVGSKAGTNLEVKCKFEKMGLKTGFEEGDRRDVSKVRRKRIPDPWDRGREGAASGRF